MRPAELRCCAVQSGLDGVGGGRGVFVSAPVAAGALLLREAPAVRVPADKPPEVSIACDVLRTCMGSALGLVPRALPNT